ncbi:MAG: hypothetical protein R3B70_23170 [Polyangiaceae bacterium]
MKSRALLFPAVLAVAAAGCTEDVEVPGPTVIVERWDAGQECFALCPMNEAFPEGLVLEQACAAPAGECQLLGGEDSLRVTVDLGEVDVPRATALAAPRVDQILDGKVTTLVNACPPREPGTTRTVFSCRVEVPAEEAASYSLRADFGSGFGGDSASFRIDEPVVEILPSSCDPANCTAEAGVGHLSFTISAAKGLPDKALVFGVLGGEPQGSVGEVTLSGVTGTRRTGTLSPKIPTTEEVDWQLTAQVGGVSSEPLVVRIDPLSLTASLTACASQPVGECVLEGGKTTKLVISAPEDVLDTTATVTTYLDGLAEPGTSEVTLVSVERGTAIGSAKIPVPNTPGQTFQVIVRVGASIRGTEIATIAAPTMP